MKRLLILALVAVSVAVPAIAKDKDPVFVVAGPVKDQPAVSLDPAKGYVMIRSDMAVPLYLMKLPTPEDQSEYNRIRSEALAKAHAKFVKKQKEYDEAVATNARVPKGSPGVVVPDKPVEPTEENFEFTPFGLLADVGIGPMNRFAKVSGGMSTYLHELTPGEYRIYGQMSAMPNGGAFGSCFCMGSVKFTVAAGEITDLGMIAAKANLPGKRPEGDSSAPLLPEGQFLTPSDQPIDPRLASAKVVPAKFHPVGKMPNYFGLTINRIPAIPGVMRYDRDRIVDLTAGN